MSEDKLSDDEKLILKNVIIVSIIAFVVGIGYGAIMPLIPFLLLYFDGKLTTYPEKLGTVADVGNIAFEITLIMSAFMLTRAFFARAFGRISDSIGRRKMLIVGSMAYIGISMMFLYARSWIDILFIRTIQGVASAMLWPVAEAMLADSVPKAERGKYMGWYMTTTNVSFFISPVLGALIYKYAVYTLHLSLLDSLLFPFYFMVLFSIIAFALSLFTVETIKNSGKVTIRQIVRPPKINIVLPKPISRSIKILYVMGLANGIAVGFVMPIASIFIMQYITSDPEAIGLLSMVAGIFGFLVNYPAGRLSDIYGRKQLVIIGQIGARVATFIVPFTRTFDQILVVYAFRAVMFNISSPAYRALQADLVPLSIRGRVFGTVQTLFNAGAALAPIGGLIYRYVQNITISVFGYIVPGVAILFWLSSIIGLLSTLLFALYVVEP